MRNPIRRTMRPEYARRVNLALVLQAIYNDSTLSRADIARTTGLTKVTVSDLVAELMLAGLVRETGTSGATRPGKPSMLLAFNPDVRDILTLDLSGPDRLDGAIFSLKGQRLHTAVRDLNGAVGMAALTAARELARELVEASTRPILGLGVGTPGAVSANGVVLAAPNLHWRDIPLQQLLADDLGIPVRVENDANAAVLAERRFAGGPDDLLSIQLTRGVGAGLLVAGHLVRGAASDAGEIGHVVIDPNGERCGCGKIGCLETSTSVPAILARIEADPSRRDALLAEAGERLGLALSPVVGMLGLSHVVIGGPDDIVTAPLLDAARSCISDRTRSEFRPELELTASSFRESAVLLGAAALVLLDQLGVA